MKILFINHSASPTGAPIVLIHFLKWLNRSQKTVDFDVLSLKTGDLLDTFTELSQRHYFNDKRESFFKKIMRYFRAKGLTSDVMNLGYPRHKIDIILKNKYDMIYANTVVSIPIAVYIKKNSKYRPKLLAHMHELNLTIAEYCPDLNAYVEDIDLTVAASNKVKSCLVNLWGFSDLNLEVVYPYSEIPKICKKATTNFIVGASGLAYWRKGPELFIMVADYVFNQLPEAKITFNWVGKVQKINRLIYENDIEKLGLKAKVTFLGKQSDPYKYFADFDVFLMTSKEDPFPLVCIEVGMMGKPIVCFKDATGTEEVLEAIDGAVVPYLNIKAMGDMVIKYYQDEQLKINHGKEVKNIFEQFNPDNQSHKIFKLIKKFSNEQSS